MFFILIYWHIVVAVLMSESCVPFTYWDHYAHFQFHTCLDFYLNIC